jgi:hypothetical protein
LVFVFLQIGKLINCTDVGVVQNRTFLTTVVQPHKFRSDIALFGLWFVEVEVSWGEGFGLDNESFPLVA